MTKGALMTGQGLKANNMLLIELVPASLKHFLNLIRLMSIVHKVFMIFLWAVGTKPWYEWSLIMMSRDQRKDYKAQWAKHRQTDRQIDRQIGYADARRDVLIAHCEGGLCLVQALHSHGNGFGVWRSWLVGKLQQSWSASDWHQVSTPNDAWAAKEHKKDARILADHCPIGSSVWCVLGRC